MKLALLFLISFICMSDVTGQSAIQWVAINVVRGVCQMRTFVDTNLVNQVREGNFTSKDENLKKYVFCVYRHLNLMDEQANINKEAALKVLPAQTDPAKFLSSVEACKNETGTDSFAKAYNILKCYNIQYPKDIVAL